MPPQKTRIILNPNADKGNAWRMAGDLRPIVDEFGGADWSGTVYPTHATQLAYQAALDGYDLVIGMGGDGTIHEVINGVMQAPADQRPRVGVIPMGSGNDFAHAVGAHPDPAKAMRQVFTGSPRRVDLALLEDEHGRREYIDNTVGIGFNATVTIRAHKLPLFIRGFLVYLVAVVQTIILNHEAPLIQFKSDQENWEDNLLMLGICNGPREGGGFMVAPEAVNNDGLLNYVAISKVSRPMMFRLLPEVMNGSHGRFRPVRLDTLKRLKLTSDRALNIHIDGEVFAGFGTDVRHLNIELMPGAIEVMV